MEEWIWARPWAVVSIQSVVLLAVGSLFWIVDWHVLASRGELIRALADENKAAYRFRDPAFWKQSFRHLSLLNAWRMNSEVGGVLRGEVAGRETWLFDYRRYGIGGNASFGPGASNESDYTVAVLRLRTGELPSCRMESDGTIMPYEAAHRLFHRPLIAELRGKWAFECDGEWLALYSWTYLGRGAFTAANIDSYRRFLSGAMDIARRLPLEYAADTV